MEGYLYRNTYWIMAARRLLPDGSNEFAWGIMDKQFHPIEMLTFSEAYLAELFLDGKYREKFND